MREDFTTGPAINRAQRAAAEHQSSMYVVWTGSGYAVADEADLDTWWLGATVVGEVMSDGTYIAAE